MPERCVFCGSVRKMSPEEARAARKERNRRYYASHREAVLEKVKQKRRNQTAPPAPNQTAPNQTAPPAPATPK